MKTLIKTIRKKANMSQQEFANKLSTTIGTINRWENEKTIPNLMAQQQLLNFCKTYQVDIFQDIIAKYTYNNDVLYHGSKNGLVGNVKPSSRSDCDFGCGFYLGTDSIQPLTLICAEENPVFYTFKLNFDNLKVLELDLNTDWVMSIAYNRGYMEDIKNTNFFEKYSNLFNDYDVVIGYIADDRLYTELTKFFKGNVTDEVLMRCLSVLKLGKQIVLRTEKACSQLELVSEYHLSKLELDILKEKSYIRREEAKSMAKDIEINYRRVGKYYDEIIKGE